MIGIDTNDLIHYLTQDDSKAYQALKQFSDKTADFSDTLIVVIAENQGCEKVITFDKKGTRVGMTLL